MTLLSSKALFVGIAMSACAALALPPSAGAVHETLGGAKAVTAPPDVEWQAGPAMLPEGWDLAVLHGDPTGTEGPVVLRLRFPAGYEIPAHSHPSFEHVVVMSGSLYLGMGEELDRSDAARLDAGGFFAIPAAAPHYAWTEEETVIQVNGTAPFETDYVDPADDPRQTN